MRIKDGFMLREIAESWIVVPIGQSVVEFNGLMTLSESGALLWNKLSEGTSVEELIKVILSEYDVDEVTAQDDVQAFICEIAEKGLIE